jgi:hypothetical protein
MILAYPDPCSTTSGEAPKSLRRSDAQMKPMTPIIAAAKTPRTSAWNAARAAPSGSFSPIRRATTAVTPNPSPIPTA